MESHKNHVPNHQPEDDHQEMRSLAGIGPFFGWVKGSKFTSPPHAAGTSRAPRSPGPETTLAKI